MKPKSKNQKVPFFIIISIFIFFSVAMNPAFGQPKRGLGTKWDPIKIGTVFAYQFMPSHRAVDILTERGVFAAAYTFPSAVERLEAVAAGYLNLSYAGLTASTLLAAAGKDIVVLCWTNEGGRAIVARKEIKTLQDLKGKKVGTVFGSIEHISLIGELLSAGINPKDVDVVNIGGYDLLPLAMLQGGIVAYCGNEPISQIGVTKYDGHILSYAHNSPMGKIDSGLETTREFIDKYPEIVYAVVKAHVEAVEYYNKNPHAAVRDAVERYKITAEVVESVRKNTPLMYDIKLGNMKALAEFLKDQGYIKTIPDWNKFVDDRFLIKAKQELGIQ